MKISKLFKNRILPFIALAYKQFQKELAWPVTCIALLLCAFGIQFHNKRLLFVGLGILGIVFLDLLIRLEVWSFRRLSTHDKDLIWKDKMKIKLSAKVKWELRLLGGMVFFIATLPLINEVLTAMQEENRRLLAPLLIMSWFLSFLWFCFRMIRSI